MIYANKAPTPTTIASSIITKHSRSNPHTPHVVYLVLLLSTRTSCNLKGHDEADLDSTAIFPLEKRKKIRSGIKPSQQT
jgi:hypothetical protein